MPSLTLRSLMKMGQGGLVLTIPKGWAAFYGLQAGDKVVVVANGELRILPEAQRRGEVAPGSHDKAHVPEL